MLHYLKNLSQFLILQINKIKQDSSNPNKTWAFTF